ncbi:MAG: hypothetical protein HRT61_17285 [Ekhidna sp.]|nr:hypothetical protein [Ekhidna sp.]
MKTKQLGLLSILTFTLVAASCTSGTKSTNEEATETEAVVEEPSISLTKAPDSPDFPLATLIKAGGPEIVEADSSFEVSFEFDVQNYELGVQTEDAATRGIANSGKGQHIHYIVNNGPYAAHYMPGVNGTLDAGNYTVLAFLSRSYHESVKSADAYHIENMVVGDVEPAPADLSAPHLFYSRPKGTYSGADTEKVMLDFYLLNTTIDEAGNKVKATINGNEFMISEWAPHYIEGLPMGENTIKLELIDSVGNAIPGPFNMVERTITLSE